MKYDVVLWDMDGTLLNYKMAQNEALTQVFRTLHIPLTDEMIAIYSRINDLYWKKLELGEVTREELLDGRFQSFFEEIGMGDIDIIAARRQYEEVLGNVYDYIQDSLDLCTTLKPKCRQYIVTNGISSIQSKKIQLSGFKDCVEGYFVSEEVGIEKPNEAFFDYVFQHIPNLDKDRTLIIGDSLTSDIKGGKLAGIKTCYFNPDGKPIPEECKPDYEIDHLWDVLRICDFVL